MTDSDSSGGTELVKTDVMGRLRTTRKQREAFLDAFDKGGLSGPDFARVHGIGDGCPRTGVLESVSICFLGPRRPSTKTQ